MDGGEGLDNSLLAALPSSGLGQGSRIEPVEIPFSRQLGLPQRWKASRSVVYHHPFETLSARGSAPSGVARFQVTKRLENVRVVSPTSLSHRFLLDPFVSTQISFFHSFPQFSKGVDKGLIISRFISKRSKPKLDCYHILFA